jgi:hypothetical protein
MPRRFYVLALGGASHGLQWTGLEPENSESAVKEGWEGLQEFCVTEDTMASTLWFRAFTEDLTLLSILSQSFSILSQSLSNPSLYL